MRTLLNILWFIFGSGFLLAIAYGLAGIICFVLIVTIPFGVASFRLARYALWPFGYTIVEKPSAGLASTLANVVWLIVAGWWLALMHIVTGIALCITLIGIPFGVANFKLVPAALWPLGREIVERP
ncbi:YccF domain-containing protein [Catellatospora vulcania]|uniref:YccF domain-containing protein n=1 Tax=Catellatospora vulcania TaxID=1460450 RepID=UPI0012D46674|nr:YccF domain-containing protein [Catellatospora vulcania]